jgi:hypothetical protein
MTKEDDMRSGNRYGRVSRRLTLIIVTANTCGAALVAFYFGNLHGGDWPGFFYWHPCHVGPLVLVIATVGLLILGNAASGRLLGPLWAWYRRAVETDSADLAQDSKGLACARKRAFDEHSRQLLETIAPPAAIAIDNAVQVLARERLLKEQIAQLRIQIDQAKRDRRVAEIAEMDYFQQLQEKAQQMREDRAEKSDSRLTKSRDSV